MQVVTELPHQVRTKQRPNEKAVERRDSGWQNWGSGSGGLRGGMMKGGGIGDASDAEVEVRDREPHQIDNSKACVGEEPRQQEQDGSHLGMNLYEEPALYYGSEGTDLVEMIDVELNRVESNDSDETNNLEQVGETESWDHVERSEEVERGPESESEEEESAGMRFLKELDRDYMYSSRLIVRGEYTGMVNGKMYKLFVRRRTEGTYVDWSLYNLDSAEQLLSIKGEMTYPYELTKKTRSREGNIYGQKAKGGWSWGGWAYGFVNLNEISNSFPKDARDVHIDMMEAVFWDSEVYDLYHVCGPNCKNESKAEGFNCSEGGCGLRVWSVMFTTYTIAAEEHDLKPTSFKKEKEIQTVFMSLVRFFSGQFKLVIHTEHRIRRYDEEVIWMSFVPNRRFNDSVAGVDWRMRERAKQIYTTSVPRLAADDSGASARVSSVNDQWEEPGDESSPEENEKGGDASEQTNCGDGQLEGPIDDDAMEKPGKRGGESNRQENLEPETLLGGRGPPNQERGVWRCIICNTSCGIVHHLQASGECLAQLKLKPEYQFRGSLDDEVFITKYCLLKGVCPHALCQDAQHASIPQLCLEWWKNKGWQLMNWKGEKEKATVGIVKQKIGDFLRYQRKRLNSGGETQGAASSSIRTTNAKENRSKCSNCDENGDLIQHLVSHSQCRRAYVNKYLTEDEVDIRKTVFQLGVVLGVCVRVGCSENTNFTYFGPHLKQNSDCLDFYHNEGIYLSLPNWPKDQSPNVISKNIAQLKRRIIAAKEKEQSCGIMIFKKELSQLLAHVCVKCGCMGPTTGEEFLLKGGWTDDCDERLWFCSSCSEESQDFAEVKRQLEDRVNRLKGPSNSPSSDVKVTRCSRSGQPILAPVCLSEDGQHISNFVPSSSTLVQVPYDASGLRIIKKLCDDVLEDKDDLLDCQQELLRRPILTDFEATFSCLYRSFLASVRQHMRRILIGLTKVGRGEVLSLNPRRTSARKSTPNIEQTMAGALRDRCGWSFHSEQQKAMESEARTNVNGQVRLHVKGTILRDIEDEDLRRILLVSYQTFVDGDIKTTEDLLSVQILEVFFISMTPIVLTYIRNKASLFVKHIVRPNFENYDLQLQVHDSEVLVEIEGYIYSKHFDDVNRFLAANPELRSQEVIETVEKEEYCLPTATLKWEKLVSAYNVGEIQAKEIVEIAERCQIGNVTSPISMLNLWTPGGWQTTEREKVLRNRVEELSFEREIGEDVAGAIIEIVLKLQDEGLFEELVFEEISTDIRRSIRRKLIELRPDLPGHSINALQWFHTLLVKTSESHQWTLKRECGETQVKPYNPLFLEALQQEVEVKIVIGSEHLEPEVLCDLGQPSHTASSSWKQISLLKFLHGLSKFEEPASQSTVPVINSQEQELNFSEATERDEECDEVFTNSKEESFVVSNGDPRKNYSNRPAHVEDMPFGQFLVEFYRKKSNQEVTVDPISGVGADSDDFIVGGETKVPVSMKLSNGVLMKKRSEKPKPVPLLMRNNSLDSYGERLLFGTWRSLGDLHQPQSEAERERLRQNRLKLFPFAVFPGCRN